jgi:4-alpha-glucanotransferase
MSLANPVPPDAEETRLVRDALRLLGKRNLVLAIHDASLPGLPDEDMGRGSPYSKGGAEFLRFARELGFTGIQFGPQGQTSEVNLSPYDGTVFSKNVLAIALPPLTESTPWGGLLDEATLEELVRGRPPASERRVASRSAFRAQRQALRAVYASFREKRAGAGPGQPVAGLAVRLEAFRRREAGWLERDGLYEAISAAYGGTSWTFWPQAGEGRLDRDLWDPPPGFEAACAARIEVLKARHADEMEFHAFGQFLVDEQHGGLRRAAAGLGLKLFGDLQIGFSVQDVWSYRGVFMRRYLMGAPPSRTNPEGQPWNYPVLDPRQYGEADAPGPARRLMAARMNKLLAEFDGIRIDHPHGLICPWVYLREDPWPLHAVQNGARLFESPDLPDHPELAALAIARPDQLNRRPGVPRHADDWVTALDPDQVRRYSALFDVIVEAARANGREIRDLLVEVLSTMPHPLGAVLARYGLGRFRVTQKAILSDPADVYRSENADPPDWVMVGNHDTPPLWLLLERWAAAGTVRDQAAYLAGRLCPSEDGRERMVWELVQDPARLAQAKMADLFACRAENVAVFFADLLGMKEIYNRPGVVSEENWTLRVPPDYRSEYARLRSVGLALNLPWVLALALRARAAGLPPEAADLADRLAERSGLA